MTPSPTRTSPVGSPSFHSRAKGSARAARRALHHESEMTQARANSIQHHRRRRRRLGRSCGLPAEQGLPVTEQPRDRYPSQVARAHVDRLRKLLKLAAALRA